jgi:hypothetical protein
MAQLIDTKTPSSFTDIRKVQPKPYNWVAIPCDALVMDGESIRLSKNGKYTELQIKSQVDNEEEVDLQVFVENSSSEKTYDSFLRRMKIAHVNKENLFVFQTLLSGRYSVYGCFFSKLTTLQLQSEKIDTVWFSPNPTPKTPLIQKKLIYIQCGTSTARNWTVSL